MRFRGWRKKVTRDKATKSERITVQGKLTGCDKAPCAGIRAQFGKGRMRKANTDKED